ncbi:hypothetical protein AB0B45_19575 [Nonomuraea sp. NPDC049152]|uniref:hypothetical protein n=1 Tax=Nonomuraea sp. NPDC049152 TaxID=3154350 RepID=UPI0033D076D0
METIALFELSVSSALAHHALLTHLNDKVPHGGTIRDRCAGVEDAGRGLSTWNSMSMRGMTLSGSGT